MDRAKLRTMLELIQQIANEEPGPWIERRKAVLAEATDSERCALEEFAGWFEPE